MLAVLIAVSFASATALILTNKKLMTDYGFNFPVSLTAFHFFLSALTMGLLVRLGRLKPDTNVGPATSWYTAALGVGSIVFMNWNLQVNSIGFYQLSKICNIPVMVAYKRCVKGLHTPTATLVSLLVLLVGVGLFSVNDVQFNPFGALVAVLAVLATAIFQSRSAYMQREFSISGPQLNHLLALPEFVICSLAALSVETFGSSGLLRHSFVPRELLLVTLTGAFAVYGNVVGFVMIGRTGPISFQVIGHVKTILVFSFGLVLFPPTVPESVDQRIKKICGLILAMAGVFLYTWFQLSRGEDNKSHGGVPNSTESGRLTAVKFSSGSVEPEEESG